MESSVTECGAAPHHKTPTARCDEFRTEIPHRLWSLWGSLYPALPVVRPTQPGVSMPVPGLMLARCVVACCAASIRSLGDWSSQLLDEIMASGDLYHEYSRLTLQGSKGYGEIALENLHTACALDGRSFWVHTEKVQCGKLYDKRKSLGAALCSFFSQHEQTGILQLKDRVIAFGFIPECAAGGAFFMFNCQAQGPPLFQDEMGAPYMLRMRQMQQLLRCIIVTLQEHRRNVSFKIHKVSCVIRN